jgi:hypothetical protein
VPARVPSLLHELLVDLFHRTPTLLRRLVGARLGVLSRRGLGFGTDHTRVSQLRDVDTDLVLKVYAPNGKLLCAIILEVQLSIKKSKARTWPLYAAWAHYRLGCPVYVVVVTVDPKVAAWAAGPFCIGDMVLRPWVIGPEHIRPITTYQEARRAIERTLLSGLAHRKGPVALQIGRALWSALDASKHEHADQYWDIFMSHVDAAVRRALEMELQGWKPQSKWGKRIYAEGQAKGEARGRREGQAEGEAKGQAKGEANALLALLRMRGIRLTRSERERIQACRDLRRLRALMKAALTATTSAELFVARG